MRPIVLSRVPLLEQILFGFLLFSVLWRGGKGLEAVWMLVGVAGVLTIADFLYTRGEMQVAGCPSDPATGRADRLQRTPLWLWGAAMGFVVWTIVSYYFSTTANYGLDEVLRDTALVLIFLWTMRRAQRTDAAQFIERFIMTIGIAAFLSVAFGVLVYAMQPVNRFVGTFFDYRFHTDYWPNAWAQFLLLAWPMMVLWMRGKSAKLQVARPNGLAGRAGCIVLGGVFGALLLSYSRGAMIACGGQLMLLGVWHFMLEKNDAVAKLQVARPNGPLAGRADCKAVIKIGLIICVALAVFFSLNALRGQYHPVQSVTDKIMFSADEGGSSVSERAQFWRQSIALIRQKPIFGWGPYSFRFIHQRLQTGVLETSDHPHNLFLKIAVERGVPAAVLFIVLLLSIFISIGRFRVPSSRLRTQIVPQPVTQNPQQFLLIAVLGVLAHNLIDYNLQFVGIALPFWMVLGILSGSAHCGLPARPLPVTDGHIADPNTLNKKIVQLFELCIAVILLFIAFYEGLFLLTSSMGRHAEARGDSVAALRWYDRSTGEYFSRDMHLSRALLATKSGQTDRAQAAIAKYLQLNAQDPRGWRLQGDIARQGEDMSAALVAYQKAYEFGRWNDLSITLALAESLTKQKTEKGEQLTLESMKPEMDALLSSFVEAIVVNEHFIALSHNAEDAIVLSTFLAEQFPKSAPRYEVLAARADFAMRSERAKVKSRPAGYLW